jgi:hypothetical protein
VSQVTVVVVAHIPKGQHVELLLSSSAGDVDGKENRPSDQAANETCHDADLEQAQEQITIKGMVVEDI